MFSQKSPIIVAQNAVNTIVGYVGLFFITRYLPPDIFGYLGFAIGFGGIFSFVADMGFSQSHQKFVSEGYEVGTCNGTYLTVKLVLGFVYAAVVVGMLLLWTSLLHRGFENEVEYWMIVAVIPYYFFQSLQGFAQAYYTAKLSPARMAIPPMAEAILRNSIFVGIGLIFYFHLSIRSTIHAAILLAVTYSISYSVYFATGMALGRPWSISKPSKEMFTMYAVVAVPLAVSGAIVTFNSNFDKVIIQFFWGAQATAGFFLDQKVVQTIRALSVAITAFFLPLLSRVTSAKDTLKFSSSIGDFERLISLFILPFIVMFIVLNKFIVNLFNGTYVAYADILSVLAVTVYFQTTIAPYISALTARGKTHVIAIVSGSTILLNIVLNLLLVPKEILGVTYLSLGVMGAAVSSLIASLLNNFLLRYTVYKREGVGTNLKVIRHLIPVSLQFTFIYLVLQVIQPFSIFILAPLGIFSLLLYLGVAILIKEITFDQVWTFVTYLNPITILKQLKEEHH